MTHFARLITVAACMALLAPLALADAPEDVKALVDELTAAAKAKDVSGATEALKKLPDVYKGTDNKALRGKLLAAVGKALKNKKLGDARLAAVDALLAVDDAKPAAKALSKLMPNPKKVEEATELQLAVVKAAGQLAQSRSIKPLTELAYKSKDKALAAAATLALGGYKADKKNRVKILEELIDIAKRTRPGRSTDKAVSPVAQERWAAVGPAVVAALNNLTGQKERDFESWEQIFKDAKKKPAALFVD